MKDILVHFGELCKRKDMIVYISVFVFLVVANVVGMGRLGASFHKAMKAKEQITTMEQYIDKYNKENDVLLTAKYKPIPENQVDRVQSELLTLIKVNNLKLSEFNVTNTVKEQNARKYELEFTGSYLDTMRFLDKFHVNNVLISITMLEMEPESDTLVHTVVQYKIYTA